jgi:glucans biosynthesis protein
MNFTQRATFSILLVTSSLPGQGQEASPLLGNGKVRLDDPLAEPTKPKPAGTRVPDPAPAEPEPKVAGAFSYDQVRALAADLALKPFVKRQAALADYWKNLTTADVAKISFRHDMAFWAGDGFGYALELAHPTSLNPNTMQWAENSGGKTRLLEPEHELFNYHGLQLPGDLAPLPGVAGGKILFPLNTAEALEPIVEFTNHTGFRGRAPGLAFGVTCSAIVLNPGTEREELPQFQRFWFDRPSAPNKALNFYALLDSPSVSGAYRFKLVPGTSTTLEVESELYFRQEVKVIGLAPMSSRCWFTELTTPKPPDFRPEVHSSDGLLVHMTEGEAIWRPLDGGPPLRHWKVQTERLLGFGLVQRDRQFASYQDLEEDFHLRPTAYIRPVGKWPSGTVHLAEQPATDAHSDNIQTYWEPEKPPQVGQPYRLGYLLHWSGDLGAPGLSKVLGSRRSQEISPLGAARPTVMTYVVDFSQSSSLETDQKQVIAAVGVEGGAKLIDKQMQKNPATGGWRAIFRIQLEPKTEKLDLSCRLLSDGRPISERWNYQWIK